MKVRSGDGPEHEPCLSFGLAECEQLYEVLRRYLMDPGPYDGTTPTLAQTWRWMDGLSFYADCVIQHAEGRMMSGNVHTFDDGMEPVKGPQGAP